MDPWFRKQMLRSCLALSLVLASCSTVRMTPDDGSGGASADVAVASATSTASTVSSASTGAPDAPREIEVAYQVGFRDPRRLLVMLHRADGAREGSWLGDELPSRVTVRNGDLVTYAHATAGSNEEGVVQRVVSYRVTPEITRIEHAAELAFGPPAWSCNSETMSVLVHIGDVPDGWRATVTGPFPSRIGHGAVPGDVTVNVEQCAGASPTFVLFTEIWSQGNEIVTLSMTEEIAFQSGATIEVTPSFDAPPRAPLTVVVDDLDGAVQSWGRAEWHGVYDSFEPSGYLLYPRESWEDATFLGARPFTYTASPFAYPYGRQRADVSVWFTDLEAPCKRSAHLGRRGASAAVIPFHVNDLADVVPVGDLGWALQGAGTLGDEVLRSAWSGPTEWLVHDDPRAPGRPAFFPSFPERLPEGFVVPTAPFTHVDIAHIDIEEIPSYAALVASSRLPESHTIRRRRSSQECATR